ncbi:MAG: SMC-Scp complex subunit ScpB [Candidatus Nanoarchaeia archaeon]|nr:SMC-Scp complex subunit ScpB [Candidatus Haiyanarchaeum thermophilum]MCW1303385.1 SMC-Scp complex subunit ScpB [Candidatus Haiyanarchaeum thermophilum]MCW1303927.1 SMC-Scp complex subunit ScpB [Candidatus Haiyanarchaeum thermophilum]MCW1306747.1 SMC-Scp complex subunit ScpB [Candidatus Haiyanarchaeum thermophilum]MCW1307412.1 SMC-Scp complex subunit ScpB [Candidatus Haiyanarchaeum thermophilum]
MWREEKAKVEALLFASSKGLRVEEICEKLKLPTNRVIEILNNLKEEYSEHSTFEVIEEQGIWKFRIREEVLKYVEPFVRPELGKGILETLAYIAYKAPVKQSEVVKFRGNKAYAHVKALLELGFISARKLSRTLLLELTQKFYEYFDIQKGEEKYLFKESKVNKENLERGETYVET